MMASSEAKHFVESDKKDQDDGEHLGVDDTKMMDMECSIYQNYTASEVFVQGLAGVVNQEDVESMVRAQKKMLQRFEKTNEMLANCNTLSATRLERATRDFKAHTAYVSDLKKDLESIFKRIRVIKSRIAAQNPEAFKAAGGTFESVKEEDDEYDVAIRMRRMRVVQDSSQQQQQQQQHDAQKNTCSTVAEEEE